ncbi:DUF4157 domain-containing protein [Corallococcus sp. 4LFB]|uniref:eCIS core domain-containing protein n=1 Tax=Corallococcus sp. 4LFB TaxID=3383249 RepID=UPI0039748E66
MSPREEDISAASIHQAAAQGIQTPSMRLPFLEKFQPLFGRYDLSQVRAHVGPEATATATAMNARAYCTGAHVVFAGTPDPRTAAHEAAHVVQQRAGVRLPGGGGQVEDMYEQHAGAVADRVASGQSAEGLLQLTAAMRADAPGPSVQRSKRHAEKYILAKKLGFEASCKEVLAYIKNKENDKELRRGLLLAWNLNQIKTNRIEPPSDLAPTSTQVHEMEDIAGWSSDEDTDWDLSRIKESLSKGQASLLRSGHTENRTGVHELSPFDAVRFGRQVVKRDAYEQLPIITSIGGFHFELNNPGTKDIYATPLLQLSDIEEEQKERSAEVLGIQQRVFKRAGQSEQFNWQNLTRNLQTRHQGKTRETLHQLLDSLLKKATVTMSQEMAEATAAILADLMKGSHGGRHHLHQMRRHLGTASGNPGDMDFKMFFTGEKPIYAPAAKGGRKRVKMSHTEVQTDAEQLLGVNNCLIHAISQAARHRNASLRELKLIREHLNNYGEMLVASPKIIRLIREVLGIAQPITVAYRDVPWEDFPGNGTGVTVYHTGAEHFEHEQPQDYPDRPSLPH